MRAAPYSGAVEAPDRDPNEPPFRFSPSPSGELPAGTTQATLGLTTGELANECGALGVTVSWSQCVAALNNLSAHVEEPPEPEPAEGPRQMNLDLAPGKPQ